MVASGGGQALAISAQLQILSMSLSNQSPALLFHTFSGRRSLGAIFGRPQPRHLE